MNGPVAILFDRLGPYHLARLRACAGRMPVCALELCGQSREYQWDPVADRQLHRVTLFPEWDSGSITGAECRERMFGCLDEEKPDAVAVPGWASAGALSALDWCRQRRRPAIIMSESTATDERRVAWKEWIKRRIVRLAAGGLVGGRPHRDYMRTLGLPDERIFEGYDVVDNGYFEAGAASALAQGDGLRASLGLPGQYFLASSRFVEKKNLSALLAAYAEYRRETGDAAWSLVLLGDGPLRPLLEAQRAVLNLTGHVLLPGFKQYGELPAYYALAGGFVHASTTEQWGLVVNEAMACGLPVLVSDRCGCAPDLVAAGENGWTFDPRDVTAIAAALKRLSDLPEAERAAMREASRRQIAAWTPDTFADGMKQAVDGALAHPMPGTALLDRILLHALTLKR